MNTIKNRFLALTQLAILSIMLAAIGGLLAALLGTPDMGILGAAGGTFVGVFGLGLTAIAFVCRTDQPQAPQPPAPNANGPLVP
ncbi:hypothetical protein ACQPZJ_23110 [Actinoplanes sp. CA-054009]